MVTRNIDIKEYSFVLIESSHNKALLFIQYPYLFNEKIIGKCIYILKPHSKDFNIKKNFLNDIFYSLKDHYVDEHLEITDDNTINMLFEKSMPECILKQIDRDIFSSNLSVINYKFLSKIYDPIKTKEELIVNNEVLRDIVNEIALLFNLPQNKIGFTGSILFSNQVGDYDVVLYVNIEKAKEIKRKIEQFKQVTIVEKQFDIDWPLRYYDSKNNLICIFIAYETSKLSPLFYKDKTKVIDEILFDSIVIDDSHSEFAPTVLKIDKPNINLIILGTACRGFFKKGDSITGKGTLVKNIFQDKDEICILIVNPWEQLFIYPFKI